MNYYQRHKAERLAYQKEYNELHNDKYLDYQSYYYNNVSRYVNEYEVRKPSQPKEKKIKAPKPIKEPKPKPIKEEPVYIITPPPVVEEKKIYPPSYFVVKFD
jgi:hypothetical protein